MLNQISVFAENKKGRLAAIMKLINDSGIDTNLYTDGYALDSNGSWHRFSAAWNIGASLTFSQRYTFGLTGSIGMTDLVESDKVSFKENAMRISFAYNF